MSHKPESQLLHIVIGGELKSVDAVEFRDLAKVELVGAYPNYAEAHKAWRARASGSTASATPALAVRWAT